MSEWKSKGDKRIKRKDNMLDFNKIYNEDYIVGLQRVPDKSVDLVVTDPPYLFVKGGMKSKNLNRGTKSPENYINTDMSDFGEEKITCMLDAISPKFKNGFNGYFFCSEMQLAYYLQYALKNKLKYNVLLWDRGVSNMISYKFFRSHVDYIVRLYSKGVSLNKVISDRPNDMYAKIKYGMRPKKSHASAKPIEVVQDFIKLSSNENDVVLDPFIGGGTTALACIRENRRFIGFEINKEYFDLSQEAIRNETRAK